MIRKLLCALMALCLCACYALAEDGEATFTLRFDEGFSLALPEDWVSYPAGEDGVRYALGDGSGQRFLYILSEPTELSDIDRLCAAIEAREDCGKAGRLDLNGQPFAAFIAPGMNASGCATLLNGEMLVFLFTPQDDPDYMLEVAGIMAGFRLR